MPTKQTVKKTIDKGSAVYDSVMSWLMGKTVSKGRFVDPSTDIRTLSHRYHLGLTDDEVQRAVATSIAAVVGHERTERLSRSIIYSHAWKAAVVTGLCALPHNAWEWPLVVVDIVFFERQMSVIRNQLRIVYGALELELKGESYAYLMPIVLRVEDIVMRHRIRRYMKQWLGKGTRWALEHSLLFTRSSLRSLIRQVFKWLGISLSYVVVEDLVDWLIYLMSTLVAGLISFWIIVPLAKHFKRELCKQTEQQAV